MVYRVVMASEISSRGSLDLENVVGAEELSEDELELNDELDDDDELDDNELDEENDIRRLLAEVKTSSGSLAGLLGASEGGETSCAAVGRGSTAGGTMMAASSCCWISSGGEQAVSVTCLVGGLLLPASPLLPGLFAKETLFFLLYKVEGGSMHMVFFTHEWFQVLRPRFLEFLKFFHLFLCVRACNPLYYTYFVFLARMLLISPI